MLQKKSKSKIQSTITAQDEFGRIFLKVFLLKTKTLKIAKWMNNREDKMKKILQDRSHSDNKSLAILWTWRNSIGNAKQCSKDSHRLATAHVWKLQMNHSL